MQMTKRNKEENFELLRVVSAIAVIALHVSAIYKNGITSTEAFGSLYESHIFTILLYNTLSRFAVPCFMMISGAFLLDNNKNIDYKYFYKKSFINVGIPTIIFSFLYFLYSERIVINKAKAGIEHSFLDPVEDVIKGAPYYHMWYLYTLFIVYLMIPFILMIKKEVKEDAFGKGSLIVFVLTMISGWTSSSILNWSIAKAVCYLGYILIGYQIRKYYLSKKNNMKAILFIVGGIITELLVTYIQYTHSIRGLAESDEKYSIIGNFNPLIVIASVLIFAGFSQIKVNMKGLEFFSSLTFLIYFFHAGVIDLILHFVIKYDTNIMNDCMVMIPLMIILAFIISCVLSWLYNKIWGIVNKNNKLINKLFKPQ